MRLYRIDNSLVLEDGAVVSEVEVVGCSWRAASLRRASSLRFLKAWREVTVDPRSPRLEVTAAQSSLRAALRCEMLVAVLSSLQVCGRAVGLVPRPASETGWECFLRLVKKPRRRVHLLRLPLYRW